jgi:cobalt-zinc-cadmium efflux system outer membrane protein
LIFSLTSNLIKANEELKPYSTIKGEVTLANTLNLDTAIKTAEENNLAVKVLEAELAVKKAAIITATAKPNPFFEGIGSRAENTYSGGINYLIETGGKRHKRGRVAQREFQAFESEYLAELFNLSMNVRRTYTKYATVLERIKLKERSIQRSYEFIEQTKKNVERGMVPIIDVSIAEQFSLELQDDLLEFQRDSIEGLISLNTLLGKDATTQWTLVDVANELTDPQKIPSLDELMLLGLSNRAELKRNVAETQLVLAQLDLAKANRIPNIQENFAIVVANGLNTSSTNPNSFTTNVRADTTIELPIINRQQGPIAEAYAKLKKLKQERLSLELITKAEIVQAYETIKLNHRKIELAERIMKASEIIAHEAVANYNKDIKEIVQVIESKSRLEQAQDDYFATIIQYQDSISDLEDAIDISIPNLTSGKLPQEEN